MNKKIKQSGVIIGVVQWSTVPRDPFEFAVIMNLAVYSRAH